MSATMLEGHIATRQEIAGVEPTDRPALSAYCLAAFALERGSSVMQSKPDETDRPTKSDFAKAPHWRPARFQSIAFGCARHVSFRHQRVESH
jgi:hypothetical protein